MKMGRMKSAMFLARTFDTLDRAHNSHTLDANFMRMNFFTDDICTV